MKPVILLGAGGHAKVLLSTLKLLSIPVLFAIDPQKKGLLFDVPIFPDESRLKKYHPTEIALVNGLGMLPKKKIRKDLFCRLKKAGYSFRTVIHPTAILAKELKLGEGVQIMAGVVIQPDVIIGENSIINTRASIDHDTVIGAHVHVAPGATLCGSVFLENDVFVGAAATIIQEITLSQSSIVPAGAVIYKNNKVCHS